MPEEDPKPEEQSGPSTRFVLAAGAIAVLLVVLALLGGLLWPRMVHPSEKAFWQVAERVYGDRNLWLPLAAANPGVSELRTWKILRVPSKKEAQAWLRAYCERRGLAYNPEWVCERETEYGGYPLHVQTEAWIPREFESESPDGRLLLYDFRHLNRRGRSFVLILFDRVSRKRLAQWDNTGASSKRSVYWREDSQRVIITMYTGLDTGPTMGDEPRDLPYACIVLDVPPGGAKAQEAFLQTKTLLSPEEVEPLMNLTAQEIGRRLGVRKEHTRLRPPEPADWPMSDRGPSGP